MGSARCVVAPPGAKVVIVPSEQSADLRDYMSKHAKTDRLDAELLARLPVLHPEGLHPAQHLGPGDPLKRAVKIRAGLVHRRSTAMRRLDSLLEILGPGWTDTLGTRMTQTTFKFLTCFKPEISPPYISYFACSSRLMFVAASVLKSWIV